MFVTVIGGLCPYCCYFSTIMNNVIIATLQSNWSILAKQTNNCALWHKAYTGTFQENNKQIQEFYNTQKCFNYLFKIESKGQFLAN